MGEEIGSGLGLGSLLQMDTGSLRGDGNALKVYTVVPAAQSVEVLSVA